MGSVAGTRQTHCAVVREKTYIVVVAGSGTTAEARTRRQDVFVLVEGGRVGWRAITATEARHHGTICLSNALLSSASDLYVLSEAGKGCKRRGS